jgi:hypothetical protein
MMNLFQDFLSSVQKSSVYQFVEGGKDDTQKAFRVISIILVVMFIVLSIPMLLIRVESLGLLFITLSFCWTVLAFLMQKEFHNFLGFSRLFAIQAVFFMIGMLPFGLEASIVTVAVCGFIWVVIYIGLALIEIREKFQKKSE